MASTVIELSLRVVLFTLTIAIADGMPCNGEKTCRIGKETFIVKATVTDRSYHESQKAEIRNPTSIKRLNDVLETMTSGSTSTAAGCSFEGTAAADLGALLDAGEGALVTLVAGEARLTAHRAVLAARSPTLAVMLCHGSQGASSGEVHIPDVEGPVLRQILAYLYTLQAPQLPGMAPQLLAAADRFGLSTLKSHCEAQVAAQLDVETAAATVVLAIRHSSTSLRQDAIAFIRAHQAQVTATRGWAEAVQYQPEVVTEVFRLLSETPVETSTQNASPGSTPAAADSQRTTATPSPPPHTPALDDDGVSRLPSLYSEENETKLIKAAKEGRLEDVEALLVAGTDVEAKDENGWTALSWAARKGHVEVARDLLGGGAEVDARDYGEHTPLHNAAGSDHVAVVRLLLAASADPNARNWFGWTPLHHAAYYDRTETAAALLEAGADKEAKDKDGRTPLDLARIANSQQVIQLLT